MRGLLTPPSLTGQTFGRYRLESALPEGQGGAAYLGRSLESLNRPRSSTPLDRAVVRIFSPEAGDSGFGPRFFALAERLEDLEHPHVVRILEHGEQTPHFYLTSEFLPEGSLHALLHRHGSGAQALPLLQALHLLAQASDGLQALHARGIVHGNLKPSNLLLEQNPRLPRAGHLLKLEGAGTLELVMGQGLGADNLDLLLGSPKYISPEQTQGAVADARSDVYSLGIVLYQACTGTVPFEVRNLREAALQHTYNFPRSPRELRSELPAELETLILRTLAKNPAERLNSLELRDGLFALLERLDPRDPRATVVEAPEDHNPLPPQFPRLEGPSAVPRVQVLEAGGAVRGVFDLTTGGLTVGRLGSNAVSLEHETVSRHHLRLEYDGREVRATDLGSTNGSAIVGSGLTEAQLPVQRSVIWAWRSLLHVGPYWLQLEAPDHLGTAGRVGVALESERVLLTPGELTELRVTVANLGHITDHFPLSIIGIPAEWVVGQSRQVELNPGTQSVAILSLRVPRESSAVAGDYPARVQASSLSDGGQEQGFAAVRFTVLPFAHSDLKLRPQTRSARRKAVYDLVIKNAGNAPMQYTLHAEDEDAYLKFRFRDLRPVPGRIQLHGGVFRVFGRWLRRLTLPLQLWLVSTFERYLGRYFRFGQRVAGEMREMSGEENARAGRPLAPPEPDLHTFVLEPLAPGERVVVKLSVHAPLRLFGRPLERPFELSARGALPTGSASPSMTSASMSSGAMSGASPTPTSGTLHHLGMIPWWLLPLLILLFLALWFFNPFKPRLSASVRPGDQPFIGQAVKLEWQAQMADRLEIRNPNSGLLVRALDPRQIKQFVLPSGVEQATTFELVAIRRLPFGLRWESDKQRLSLTPRARPVSAPKVGKFSVSRTELVLGQPLQLCWDVVGADSVKISPLEEKLSAKGCKTVTPTARGEETFVLSASRKGVAAPVESHKVMVKLPQARLSGFTLSQTRVVKGDGDVIVVNYQSVGASEVTLEGPDGGPLPLRGPFTLAAPQQTSRYTLTARNEEGRAVPIPFTITVIEPPPTPVVAPEPTPPVVISVPEPAPVPAAPVAAPVEPKAAQVPTQVKASKPEVVNFVVDPPRVLEGQPVRVRWSVKNVPGFSCKRGARALKASSFRACARQKGLWSVLRPIALTRTGANPQRVALEGGFVYIPQRSGTLELTLLDGRELGGKPHQVTLEVAKSPSVPLQTAPLSPSPKPVATPKVTPVQALPPVVIPTPKPQPKPVSIPKAAPVQASPPAVTPGPVQAMPVQAAPVQAAPKNPVSRPPRTAARPVSTRVLEPWFANFGSLNLTREGPLLTGQFDNRALGIKGTLEARLSADSVASGVLRYGGRSYTFSQLEFNFAKRSFSGLLPGWGKVCGAAKRSYFPDGCGYQGIWNISVEGMSNALKPDACRLGLLQREETGAGRLYHGCRGQLKDIKTRFDGGNLVLTGLMADNPSLVGATLSVTLSEANQSFEGSVAGRKVCGWKEGSVPPASCPTATKGGAGTQPTASPNSETASTNVVPQIPR